MWSRSDALWLLLTLSIVACGFWWPNQDSHVPHDSFSTGPRGKKAFFLLSKSLAGDVRRNTQLFTQKLDDYATICVLGPARYPTEPEWDALYDWVRDGGRLVFAARHDDPKVDRGPFTLSSKSARISDEDEEEDDEEMEAHLEDDDFHTVLLSGNFDWQSNGRIVSRGRRVEILVNRGDAIQVARKEFGLGTIVVCASDAVFTNESLADATHENGRLAFRIFESAGRPQPVAMDEVLNWTGTPKLVGILLDAPLRYVTLQIVLCVVLFAWWGSRRFGPLRKIEGGARRRLVQHAEALGNLHLRTHTGPHLVGRYLERLRRALVFGVRYRVDSKELRELIEEARRHAEKKKASTGEAASLLRRLARVRSRVTGSKGE